MLEADLGAAAVRAFARTLGEAKMRLFHPLGFMLASPVETPEEAIQRFTAKPPKPTPEKKPKRGKKAETEPEMLGPVDAAEEGFAEDIKLAAAPGEASGAVQAFLEDKYDGMRAQVHCGVADLPGRVAIYSRNREDITESFPELVEAFGAVAAGELILDGEILGWDFSTGQALPFAVLGQRIGRKRVGNEWRQQVPVIFMAFDLMSAGGELLLPLPLRDRRNRLEAVVEELVDVARSPLVKIEKPAQGSMFEDPTHHDEAVMNGAPGDLPGPLPRLMIAPSRLVESAEEIDRAYADARARANEGVMLKAAGSPYLPGRRGLWWVKLKRELATLDVVITGAEYGHGRRAGLLSDYTFAVRAASGELENVGKAYSGVTDAEIAHLTEFLKAHTVEDHGHFRTVEPLVILEVAFNNIMRSDRHASGFALRFPRILRIRDDKPLAEIDTVERVEEIYQSQVDKPTEEA
jgi:DNA ligase-1